MKSVTLKNAARKPVVAAILESLQVDSAADYQALVQAMETRTRAAQKGDRYVMLVVRVVDDQGNEIQDYDFYLLGSKDYHRDRLPKGFFVDRQKNRMNNNQLTYYLNATKMHGVADGKLGIRIVARPDTGLVYYHPGEFRADTLAVEELVAENATLLLDVVLTRHVAARTFSFDPVSVRRHSFKE